MLPNFIELTFLLIALLYRVGSKIGIHNGNEKKQKKEFGYYHVQLIFEFFFIHSSSDERIHEYHSYVKRNHSKVIMNLPQKLLTIHINQYVHCQVHHFLLSDPFYCFFEIAII
jgi:hypothetical protein